MILNKSGVEVVKRDIQSPRERNLIETIEDAYWENDKLRIKLDKALQAMKELAKRNGSCLGCINYDTERYYGEDICYEGYPQCDGHLDCWTWEGLEDR